MPRQNKVLVVGSVDILDTISTYGQNDVTIASHSEEAIQLLIDMKLDYVIIDAAHYRDHLESCLDILRFFCEYPRSKTAICVCRRDEKNKSVEIPANHRKEFIFTTFPEVTVRDFLEDLVSHKLTCA